MSGSTSRSGFAFQDLVLTERILAHIHDQRASAIDGRTPSQLEFGVEASPVPGSTPEWDSIQGDGAHDLLLEETKSGAVDAEDRRTLWRRVRRTILGLAANPCAVSVRLTVNADALPHHPERWRMLASLSEVPAGTWSTPETQADGHVGRSRSVRSAEDLAKEAIHMLTEPDVDTSAPLTVDHAREILRRFSFNELRSADSVEAEVRSRLQALSPGLGVDELLNCLRGEIAQRAESPDATRRRFVADDLLRSISMLERLAAVDPAALRRWHAMRAAENSAPIASSVDGDGLAYKDWRAVQPGAATVLDQTTAGAVAVVGRGGVGKSIVLRSWLLERRQKGDEAVFLAATDLAGLEGDEIREAMALGAFAARHRGRRLVVGIDGLENVGNQDRLAALLAALRQVGIDDDVVCVTIRLLQWRTARGTAERVEGWKAIELVDWPEDHVRDCIGPSHRPKIGPDLLRLLRTPLLLDIFLRTFGREVHVPEGLQSRHGLLQAYWDRRILPDEDERSPDRRKLLIEIAKSEATGRDHHTVVGDVARDLTSEGLLLSHGGQRSFRHALLRDFAMMTWALDGASSPADVVANLKRIQPSLVRFGALRAVLEAGATTRATDETSAVLSMAEPPMLFDAATVLGEFEDTSRLCLPALIDAIGEQQRPAFLQSLFAAIRLNRNGAWLASLARLPDDPDWAENARWLNADGFRQLVDAIEVLVDTPEFGTFFVPRIAPQLRSWSMTPELRGDASATGDFVLGRLIRLLSQHDPCPTTVEWLRKIVGVGAWTRFWCQSELPGLVRLLVDRGFVVDDDDLRLIYCQASALHDDVGRLRDDAEAPRFGIGAYERVTLSLIGEGAVGLVECWPSAFVPVAIDLIAGYEADQADGRAKMLSEIGASFPEDLKLFAEPPQLVLDLEAEARRIAGAKLGANEAGGELIVDDPSDPYWDLDDEYKLLILHLRRLAEASLQGDGEFFDKFFWPSVDRSMSALARACVVDLLTRQGTPRRDQVLDQLLQDRRTYFITCARRYVQQAIRARWCALSPKERAVVVENIRDSGREPAGNVYNPGPFVWALPEAERPSEMQAFIDLYQAQGWNLEIQQAQQLSVTVRGSKAEPVRDWTPIPGLSATQQAPWREFAKWEGGQIRQAAGEEWAGLVSQSEALVTRCLPAPRALVEHPRLLNLLTEFAFVNTQITGRDVPHLSARTLLSLASWALDALRVFPAATVVADCREFDTSDKNLPLNADLWIGFAHLADTVLWSPELKGNLSLNDSLFEAVDETTTKDLPALLAWHLLSRVRGWFRAGTRGKGVLWSLLADRVRQGHALSAGLSYLEDFGPAEQQVLLRKWLTESLSPVITPARIFARNAGQHLGWAALMRYPDETPTGTKNVIRDLVVAPSTDGLLADPSIHALFVAQTVSGAKEALAGGGVHVNRADEYRAHMEGCWTALLPSLGEADRRGAPPFAFWVFHAILDTKVKPELSPAERLEWWRSLRSLAVRVVREGPLREAESLFRNLKQSPFLRRVDTVDVLGLLDELNSRVQGLEPESLGDRGKDAISSASSVIEQIAPTVSDAKIRDRLFALVTSWGAPPIGNAQALAAGKLLRGS